MNPDLIKKMQNAAENANNINNNKTPHKPVNSKKGSKSKKQQNPRITNHKHNNKSKPKSNFDKHNTAFKVTKTEIKNKNTKSNNKTGHVLLTPIMVDIHQVAQIDALKRMLKLKNRAQVLEILLNKRQTVYDVVSGLSHKISHAKEQFEMRYKIFLDDHEPKVKRNYRKYHTSRK